MKSNSNNNNNNAMQYGFGRCKEMLVHVRVWSPI